MRGSEIIGDSEPWDILFRARILIYVRNTDFFFLTKLSVLSLERSDQFALDILIITIIETHTGSFAALNVFFIIESQALLLCRAVRDINNDKTKISKWTGFELQK